MGSARREESQRLAKSMGSEARSEPRNAKKTWFCGVQTQFEEGVAEGTAGDQK